MATEIKVTFTADGVSDYEIAYQWGAAVPAEAWVPGTGVTAGQVQYRLYLDGTQVDEVVKFIADSPLQAAEAGTASLVLGGVAGEHAERGEAHRDAVRGDKRHQRERGVRGVRRRLQRLGRARSSRRRTGWYTALVAEQCSVRAQAVQPG